MRRLTQFAFPYVLLAVTIMLIITSITAINANESATENHNAICTFREDLQARVDQSRRIIQTNPELIQEFGLTVKQVRVQIQQQQASVDSLAGIDCD